MQVIIGVDVGTTGVKAVAFDLNGSAVSTAYREYGCVYPCPGWVEQDADMLVESTYSVIREIVDRTDFRREEILSVGFSTQRCSLVFVDENDRCIKSIPWNDTRALEQADRIRNIVSDEEHYEITGFPIEPNWMLPKLMWVRENEPSVWEKTRRVVQFSEYLLKKFGADDYVLPAGDAGYTSVWDVSGLRLREDLIRKLDYPRKAVPTVRASGALIGRISAEAARITGLPENLKLGVAVGDTTSAGLGAGICRHGDICVSMGTTCVLIACVDKPVLSPGGAFLVTNHVVDGRWEWEGVQKSSASVFNWFKDEFCSYEKQLAERTGENVFSVLNDIVTGVRPGSDGLLCLPFFAGEGTPGWNPNTRGAFLGLTFAHGRKHMLRACMEGIALEQKGILKSYMATWGSPGRLRLIGGVTRSGVWNQMRADMYGVPVETMKVVEAAALGAAIVGAVCSGVFADCDEAAASLVKADRTYEPDMNNYEIYEELYGIYRRALEGFSVSGVTDAIAGFQNKTGISV